MSVARALGEEAISTRVVHVPTALGADRERQPRDLPLKHHERVFYQRVPLTPTAHARIKLFDEWRYASLGQASTRDRLLSREETAGAWFREEYLPVVEALAAADVGGPGTETERYLRIVMLRYLLLHTHDWSDDVIERIFGEIRQSPSVSDTLVHRIIKEKD